ncbi:MAG TPA: type VI secretion system baseplate subunit TssG [Acidobacteriaceae bacterium]|nr:type VI secretion system baseplate subunit TssG [Acidobacteriaceae bacterium]
MAAEIGTEDADMSVEPIPPVDADAAAETMLLMHELAENPTSFEFFQAVTLLERLRAGMRPVGHFSDPEDEVVRFRANPRLAFPASEIQELEMEDGRPAEMMVNFMGLTGPMGVLPHPYSELILERARHKDRSLAAFFDIFNHRAVSLFYRAWQKARFPVTYGAAKRDLFSQYLLDLVGLGTAGLRDRQEIEDETLLHYVSLVGMQTRSATALQQLLEDYFEVPVEIEEFTGAWYAIDRGTQCRMTEDDSPSRQVGLGAVVGDAIWDRQGRVRIRIGPLSLERYEDFLPAGSAYRALQSITRFFSNQQLDFEAQLVLERADAPPVVLDADAPGAARLGWVSWACTQPLRSDPDDTVLAL